MLLGGAITVNEINSLNKLSIQRNMKKVFKSMAGFIVNFPVLIIGLTLITVVVLGIGTSQLKMDSDIDRQLGAFGNYNIIDNDSLYFEIRLDL